MGFWKFGAWVIGVGACIYGIIWKEVAWILFCNMFAYLAIDEGVATWRKEKERLEASK